MECRCCKETISDGAIWCPKCHRPQSFIRELIPPQAIAVILIALSGYWFVTDRASEKSMAQFNSEPIYEGGNQLVISDTSLTITESNCETCITTIGTIKNNTDTAWSNIHFQVTYLNSANEIIDVQNDEDMDLVVGPNSELKFKVKGKAATKLSDYDHNSVVIIKASPDRSWY